MKHTIKNWIKVLNSKKNKELKWVLILSLSYVIIFSVLSIIRHYGFYSGWDLGITEQAIWNTIKGKFFYSYDFAMNYLGNHFNIIFLLIMPLYYLLPYTETILIIQSLSFGIGAIGVFLLAKKILDKKTGLILATVYLINPILWNINLEDFHPITFAVPLILFAYYYHDTNKTAYWIFLITTLSIKENLSVVVAFLGIYFIAISIINKKKSENKQPINYRDLGIKTLLIGVIWFIIVINIISPILNQGANAPNSQGKYVFYTIRYSYLGDSTGEIIKTIITHPIYTFTHTDLSNKIFYLLFFPVSFALIPIASLFGIVAIPTVMQNILTIDKVQICPIYHHSTILIPTLFIATILGLLQLKKIGYEKTALKTLVAISIISAIFIGLVPFFGNADVANEKLMNGQRCFNNEFRLQTGQHKVFQTSRDKVRSMIENIPYNTTIVSSQHLFPQLVKKGQVITGNHLLVNPQEKIDEKYMIIHTSDIWNGFTDKFIKNYQILGYKLIFQEDDLYLYERQK